MSTAHILMMSLAEIVGDFGFKGVARVGDAQSWAAGLTGYVGVIYYLVKSLAVGNVSYVNGMWDGVSGILETVVAYLLFGERLNSGTQYIGICMIAVGLVALKSCGISH